MKNKFRVISTHKQSINLKSSQNPNKSRAVSEAGCWRHGRDLEPGKDSTLLQNEAYRSSSAHTRRHRIDASTGEMKKSAAAR